MNICHLGSAAGQEATEPTLWGRWGQSVRECCWLIGATKGQGGPKLPLVDTHRVILMRNIDTHPRMDASHSCSLSHCLSPSFNPLSLSHLLPSSSLHPALLPLPLFSFSPSPPLLSLPLPLPPLFLFLSFPLQMMGTTVLPVL